MRNPLYDTTRLKRLLESEQVCTLDELMQALGTRVRMTVFRKLSELPYLTSYSHRGKYYTLRTLCRFDDSGLWSRREAWFSRYGTLRETCGRFVERSEAGFTVAELDRTLHVHTQQALRYLHRQQSLHREKFNGVFVYLSRHERDRRGQRAARRERTLEAVGGVTEVVLAHELKAAIVLFLGLLDERQRRCYAGLESLRIGQGGDARIARLLGIDPHTVARGRRQLLAGDLDSERVRKRGGGRPPAEKKTPEIMARIEALLQEDVAGDPVDGLRWTRKTTEKIADGLARLGIEVSARTVARLLAEMGFSLKTARKTIESGLVESHRTPALQRNQQKRGRYSLGNVRNRGQLHRYDHHEPRAGGRGNFVPRRIQHG